MTITEPDIAIHKQWIGLLQPVGLVVSAPALVKAQAMIDRSQLVPLQEKFLSLLAEEPLQNVEDRKSLWIKDFPRLTVDLLGWEPSDLLGGPSENLIPASLYFDLPDYRETLKPTYAVPDTDNGGWLLLVQETEPGILFDDLDSATQKGNGWHATPQEKFERLLRETDVPVGLLFNGISLRLVYAPRGESSGHITFRIQDMAEVGGRNILGALHMLLEAPRLFLVEPHRRLSRMLSYSREVQAQVSNKLSEQVLDALWELLRGFQHANAHTNGSLLGDLSQSEPNHIYGGLITTLMRLVFLLYSEDKGVMPGDDVYQQNYSINGLFQRLREDAGSYPDTMDQRYGAWSWLLSLFRLVYDGGGATPEYLPARHGQLFDPDEYPFLEGRSKGSKYLKNALIEPPRIPDSYLYRVLDKLLVLDGERLSYRTLDVEQIGSVYEGIMGYTVEQAQQTSIGVYSKPKGSKVSTTVVINLEEMLETRPADRSKKLKESANCELTDAATRQLKEATSLAELVAAIGSKVSQKTPQQLPTGTLYFQPTEERRRSGSHYTPRKLTQPIVETTLRPIFQALGEHPTADQILELKICDPAMGSGAFLVEACRQLAEKLVEAWTFHGLPLDLPTTEEPLLIARRLVAQRCLYGVDKNPFAVNLAKLSLWLATLAKDLPFTFVDHSLRCGDSLVGVTQSELQAFIDEAIGDRPLLKLLQVLETAKDYRTNIESQDTRTDEDAEAKLQQLDKTNRLLRDARLIADFKVALFFDSIGKNQREKRELNASYLTHLGQWLMQGERPDKLLPIVQELILGEKPIIPFHWALEFPEVFDRPNSGFDAIIGNPPFSGKNTTINANRAGYLDWLKEIHIESHGNADLVAYFYRRAFSIIRTNGTFGLIATNTIAQGDSRSTGLRYICNNGGTIFNAQKRLKWPGLAAVVVSVVNVIKGVYHDTKILNRRDVSEITAFLFHSGGHDDPVGLNLNSEKSFIGSYVLGMGFTFDNSCQEATPLYIMDQLILKNPDNSKVIFPYIGGDEVNSRPDHSFHRYVINFGDLSENEARKWPEVFEIIERKVKGTRASHSTAPWWQFERLRRELYQTISKLPQIMVCARHQPNWSITFMPSSMVFSEALVVFALSNFASFSILQSRVHEIWARFFGSSMKDDLRYNPSDCFETFPFAEGWEINQELENAGKEYYEFRAKLMAQNNQGMTDTYNRFHNPDELDNEIQILRDLHEKLDQAVLNAYGWNDISTKSIFELEYEDEDSEEGSRNRKKPWRYRWPEEIHDEVLARLLELNSQRYAEEISGGLTISIQASPDEAKPKTNRTKMPRKKSQENLTLPLFPAEELLT